MEVTVCIGLLLVGAISLFYLIKPKHKPFHIDVKTIEMKKGGINIFPLIHFMMSIMPDSMRKKTLTEKVRLS